jgi:hypothetical protein
VIQNLGSIGKPDPCLIGGYREPLDHRSTSDQLEETKRVARQRDEVRCSGNRIRSQDPRSRQQYKINVE